MSRSLLARLHSRFTKPDAVSRRDFMAASLAASSAWMLSRRRLHGWEPRPVGKSVTVIGAGFAGLACAYELKKAGYDVRVIEAQDRVGGRVLSVDKFVPGRNVEFGAELIGSNHPTWVAYKDTFKLEWLDVSFNEKSFNPFVLGGKVLSEEEARKLDEECDEVFKKLDIDAAAVNVDEPWLTPNAKALDERNIGDWIQKLDCSPLCKQALVIEFYSNNGQVVGKQSYLGNLASIQGGGGAQKYRDDSEVWRCKGGNQQLAHALAKEIGDRVYLNVPVKQVDQKENKVVVTGRDGREIECDDVVLAVPPSVWHKITFNPPLPADLMPQMGSNVKYFATQKQRIWDKDGAFSQYACGDGKVSMTWEGTDAQEGAGDCVMVAFSGAQAAEACRALKGKEQDEAYTKELEQMLPGYKANSTGKTAFMDWPGLPWSMASYSFPAPGQVTKIGPQLRKGFGRIHFAGEHTCYKFVGYMEGGLNSGAALAARLAKRDAVTVK